MDYQTGKGKESLNTLVEVLSAKLKIPPMTCSSSFISPDIWHSVEERGRRLLATKVLTSDSLNPYQHPNFRPNFFCRGAGSEKNLLSELAAESEPVPENQRITGVLNSSSDCLIGAGVVSVQEVVGKSSVALSQPGQNTAAIDCDMSESNGHISSTKETAEIEIFFVGNYCCGHSTETIIACTLSWYLILVRENFTFACKWNIKVREIAIWKIRIYEYMF
ncbi:hypothetical protein ACHQM5_015293 [Ranunculus cassubicifolius]